MMIFLILLKNLLIIGRASKHQGREAFVLEDVPQFETIGIDGTG